MDQKFIKLEISGPRMMDNKLIEKTEIFSVAVNQNGNIAVNTEFGEVMIFDSLKYILTSRNKRNPIVIKEFTKVKKKKHKYINNYSQHNYCKKFFFRDIHTCIYIIFHLGGLSDRME